MLLGHFGIVRAEVGVFNKQNDNAIRRIHDSKLQSNRAGLAVDDEN